MKRTEPLELRLYRALLRFYPERFQRAYGEDMLSTFRDTLQDATLEGRLPSFWLESLADLVSSLRRERRAARRGKPVMNRYTQGSRLVFHYAREEQYSLRHSDLVNAEHILLGALRDPRVHTALLEFGCTLEAVREKIKTLQPLTATPWSGTVPQIAIETRRLMELASRLARMGTTLARANNDQVIQPSHMLLAILEQPSSLACQVLTSFATSEQIRSAMRTSSV